MADQAGHMRAAFLEFEELSRAVGDNVRRAQRQLQRSVGRLPFADALAAAEGSGLAPHAPPAAAAAAPGEHVVCIEFTKGKRRLYSNAPWNAGSAEERTLVFVDDEMSHQNRLRGMFAEYLLPQGFPESVAPQYATYMGWRAVQYFFGGAMSVFTTGSLLGALGVANRRSGEAAAAINWVLKDGAGRLGRFLFARWGRELDCELKQFRLAGDALMETGAVMELATALAPQHFLLLACTANLSKNLAAVAASATRAPIYRTFAKQNNLADITAKGESVANLADVLGTGFGILLTRAATPLVPTFGILSLGYLLASRREVDSVVLPYLNRARLSYVARAFWNTGRMPGPEEGNSREVLLPWNDPVTNRLVLGAQVADACEGPEQLATALRRFHGRQYALTYRPSTHKVYVLLKCGASTEDVLQGALDAHTLIYMMDSRGAADLPERPAGGLPRALRLLRRAAGRLEEEPAASEAALAYVAKEGVELRSVFRREAAAGGWRLHMTMLNPRQTRLSVA